MKIWVVVLRGLKVYAFTFSTEEKAQKYADACIGYEIDIIPTYVDRVAGE